MTIGLLEEQKKEDEIDKLSNKLSQKVKDKIGELAEDHVDWLLDLIRPLLLTEFEHGAAHGYEIRRIEEAREIVDSYEEIERENE